MPVAATVVGDPPMPAVGAGFDMAAERGGAAMLDRRHDLELMQAEVPGMGHAIGRPRGPEDVGDLERGAHRFSRQTPLQIGSASCRERGWSYGSVSGVAGAL